MLTCPLCKTTLPAPTPRCPRCQTDLSLLADFVSDLKTLLDKADTHRRAGEMAPAVQAYLDVLEVDSTNTEAREAVGPVLRALRAAAAVDRPKRRTALDLWVAAIIVAAFLAGFLLCLWFLHDVARVNQPHTWP
jgi:hypothetical protein